ncbi:hypothetical protein CG740_39045 [Streptomyces sp. CB01201]|uniref:hypothetical protein n=1 Tax=Streptomyces sp. CB01201 TaxID=2020324 RepID=UPI000C27191E|nr:hypothetical protein [Streptomyces sp. CB01201]PJM97838.1 hypothetical protein CG740_39045 [Streptomyces sp. CB01201]
MTPNSDFANLPGGDEDQARDAVKEVMNWYNTQILAQRRSPVRDEERLAHLTGARKEATTALQALDGAGPEETARIAALYAARLKALREKGSDAAS